MEELQLLIEQYAIFPIAVISLGVGYIIKHYIAKIPNKFIPLILGVLGLILNVCFNWGTFNLEIVLTGLGSGLVATGSFEAVRNLAKKKDSAETKE